MSNDIARLNFIDEKINDIFTYKDRFDTIVDLLNDKMGFDAVLMSLLQIGETLHKLDQSSYSKVLPIKGAYDVRNFIAHDYEGVNKMIIEDIIRNHLPSLKITIEDILQKEK